MTAYTSHLEDVRPELHSRDRVAELLGRYPHVSEQDRSDILAFMRKGRHLDIGLLTANDKLRPKLDAFMRDHRAHFRVKWGEAALVIGGIAALLIVLWLIWEAFS
jgi:hypothetical protein